jgi:hypothetical protein
MTVSAMILTQLKIQRRILMSKLKAVGLAIKLTLHKIRLLEETPS